MPGSLKPSKTLSAALATNENSPASITSPSPMDKKCNNTLGSSRSVSSPDLCGLGSQSAFDDEVMFRESVPLSPSSSSSSSSVEEKYLREQVTRLQEDVFALRIAFDGELAKMRDEFHKDLISFEQTLFKKMEATIIANNNNNNNNNVESEQVRQPKCSCPCTCGHDNRSPVVTPPKPDGEHDNKYSVSVTPSSIKLFAPPLSTPTPPEPSSTISRMNSNRWNVWGQDFIDGECGSESYSDHSHSSMFGLVSDGILDPTAYSSMDADAIAELQESFEALGLSGLNASSLAALRSLANGQSSSSSSNGGNGEGLTETRLVRLAIGILLEHGAVPVGKMGSLLHRAANDHTLPSALKERYGGLKKFLQSQPRFFCLAEDHPYNPHVSLAPHLVQINMALNMANPNPNSSNSMITQSPPHTAPITNHHAVAVNAGYVNVMDNGLLYRTPNPGALSQPHSRSDSAEDSTVFSSFENDREASSPSNVSQSGGIIPSRSMSQPVAATVNARFLSSSTSSNYRNNMMSMNNMIPSTSYCRLGSLFAEAGLTAASMGSTAPLTFSDEYLTDVLALDCEMVGVGPTGVRSMLARCSIVNWFGALVYDVYVRPSEPVSDYRTHVSGIRASDLDGPSAIEFSQVRNQVSIIVSNRLLIAHSISSDLEALILSHPQDLIRDTAFCPLLCPSRPLSLKRLVRERLGWNDFQQGEHNSVDDARAVLALYKLVSNDWESLIQQQYFVNNTCDNGDITNVSDGDERVKLMMAEERERSKTSLTPSPLSSSSYRKASTAINPIISPPSHSHRHSNNTLLSPTSSTTNSMRRSPSHSHLHGH